MLNYIQMRVLFQSSHPFTCPCFPNTWQRVMAKVKHPLPTVCGPADKSTNQPSASADTLAYLSQPYICTDLVGGKNDI